MKRDGNTLAAVVIEVLEQFALLFGDPEEHAPIPTHPREYIEAALSFAGKGEHGELRIAAPVNLCREMAANVLGADEQDVPQAAPSDALMELANIIVGSLTARRYGPQAICTLQAPTAREVDRAYIEKQAARDDTLCLSVDESLFLATETYIPQQKGAS